MYVRKPKRIASEVEMTVFFPTGGTIEVIEGAPYVETGILDTDGTPICRLKEPIGFRRTGGR
jgi:hypothetical protein